MPAASFQPQTIDLSASFIQLIRTALNNPRVTLDKTGLKATDANGNTIFDIDALLGTLSLTGAETLILPAFDPLHGTSQTIQWVEAVGGGVAAQIEGYRNAANVGGDAGLIVQANPTSDAAKGKMQLSAISGDQNGFSYVELGTTGGPINVPSYVKAHAQGQFTTPGVLETADVTVIDETGKSGFLKVVTLQNATIAFGQSSFVGNGTSSVNPTPAINTSLPSIQEVEGGPSPHGAGGIWGGYMSPVDTTPGALKFAANTNGAFANGVTYDFYWHAIG